MTMSSSSYFRELSDRRGKSWLSLLVLGMIPIAFIVIVLLVATAFADASFYGTVTVSGTPVPDGTIVYARAGIHLSSLVAVENGSYTGLRLDPPQDLPERTIVDFFVGGILTSPGEDVVSPTVSASLSCSAISHRPGTDGVRAGTGPVWETGLSKEFNLSLTSDVDTDGDGLSDGEELLGSAGYRTEPTLADTDGDGLDDGTEVNSKGSDPTVVDSDCDGIPDPEDFFVNWKNQWVYAIAGSIVGTLATVSLLTYHLFRGLTPGRKLAISRKWTEKQQFRELVEQVRLLATDKYKGYIKLSEVVAETGVESQLALRCLAKLGAKNRDEYFVVDVT
jgi:hypothetical protein